MARFFGKWFGGKTKSSSRKGRPHTFRPQMEGLEERQLLSATGAFQPGDFTKQKLETANASSANGMSVIAWTERFSSTDTDIKAQLYDARGARLGDVITVAGSTKNETQPTVAMDNNGNFVVAWTLDFSSTNKDIQAQLFSVSGGRSARIAVAADPKSEFDPSVAMAANGNFVVSWTLQFSSSDLDIRARRFTSAGIGATTGSFAVSAGTSNETASSAAMTDDGRFVIAFQFNNNIFLKRFSASGQEISLVPIAIGTQAAQLPAAAMDAFGNSVVAWQQMGGGTFDIQARRVSASGSMGDVLPIIGSTSSLAQETTPAVAMSGDGSSYVVAFRSVQQLGDGVVATGLKVAEVSKNSSGTDVIRRTFGAPGITLPALSFDGNNNYFLSYTDYNAVVKGQWGQVSAAAPTTKLAHDFNIEINFVGTNWTTAQKAVFKAAAARWERVILADLPDTNHFGQLIDDILIDASLVPMDGPGDGTFNILGSGTFDSFRSSPSHLPDHGHMNFDSFDTLNLDVVTHEMGHVLGVGTLWGLQGLLMGGGTSNPMFVGTRATAEFNRLFGLNNPGVSVENVGGEGTVDAHWRDAVLGDELMTSFHDPFDFLSRITVASLADMGYTVDMNEAEPYTPPLPVSQTALSGSNVVRDGNGGHVVPASVQRSAGPALAASPLLGLLGGERLHDFNLPTRLPAGHLENQPVATRSSSPSRTDSGQGLSQETHRTRSPGGRYADIASRLFAQMDGFQQDEGLFGRAVSPTGR